MPGLLFVGEKPSLTAYRNGWRWEDGRLAAATLFAALRAANVDPAACGFVNLFGDHPDAPEHVERGSIAVLRGTARAGVKIIALGEKVRLNFVKFDVPHVAMVHPAARGAIRAREAYAAHVAEVVAA